MILPKGTMPIAKAPRAQQVCPPRPASHKDDRSTAKYLSHFSKPVLIQYILKTQFGLRCGIIHRMLEVLAFDHALREQTAIARRMERLLKSLHRAKAIERRDGWIHFTGYGSRRYSAIRKQWITYESLSRSHRRLQIDIDIFLRTHLEQGPGASQPEDLPLRSGATGQGEAEELQRPTAASLPVSKGD